ncbi:heme peroxidase [Starkeya sp. ORNL1]|uniref:peroxidase family protein n=1 Tax=Starkeya sp. ORNL1 TaxID=2709380 RepID=UPI0014647EFB|nr:peroxidase family protein [Starkeya sp. ORNL1]QJP14969.1 heme peroxidase [Starkeya sp. ORNL1]
MNYQRNKSSDRLWPRLRSYLLHNFEPVWRFVQSVPFLARILNAFMINTAVNASRARPHAFSTLTPYTSWSSLTDRTYFARHLPPEDGSAAPLPPLPSVLDLFRRDGTSVRECPKSTLLFPVFAQYLTDGFLRTNMVDRRRTTSNHEIDLSTLYGRTPAQTAVLRSGLRGRMKSQMIGDEEYPPFLFEADGRTIRAEFLDAAGQSVLDPPLGLDKFPGAGFERQLFAVGGDRANATPLVSMFNTLLLREHNRLAAELEKRNPGWDDERLFQTARNILVAMYIKIVIEEYINHISSACFKLAATPAVAWTAGWNRPNWMTVEFALLYRWHSLIPDRIAWDGAEIDASQMVLDNRFLTSVGLAKGFQFTSAQNATAIGLHNTAAFLERVEEAALNQGRNMKVARYNAYREAMSMNPVTSFDQITGDPKRQQELKAVYGTPDALEFYTALFAEDVNPNTPMPGLMGAMVALDAFSQALTNPLLCASVFNTTTFTEWGMEQIEATPSVFQLVARNVPGALAPGVTRKTLGMTRGDWVRSWASF